VAACGSRSKPISKRNANGRTNDTRSACRKTPRLVQELPQILKSNDNQVRKERRWASVFETKIKTVCFGYLCACRPARVGTSWQRARRDRGEARNRARHPEGLI